MIAHPGHITFYEGARVVSVTAASSVPDAVRFAPGPRGLVPVVKVVATGNGEQRSIHEYGPDGALLRTTLLRRSA